MLQRAVSPALRKRINRREAILVIVETPSAAWTEPMATVAREMLPHVHTTRASAPRRASAGIEVSIVDEPLLAFTPERDFFHPSVFAAADAVVTAKITPTVVTRAIERCYKTRELVSAADIAGLDFHDLCLALRPGSTAKAAVERLARSSSARRTTIDDGGEGLDTLVGYGAALAEIRRIAADLVRVRDGRLPGRLLPSVLLWGAPGVGKTQLVRALARTAGTPFVTTTVSHWFAGSPTGLTPVLEKARAFFEQAASSAPCIAFIDEIDGLPDRARVDSHNRDYWTPIVTEVLTLIDRTRRRGGVLLVAATNRPDDLDAALRRAGRFDRHIEIVRPQTDKEIAAIFRAYLGADLKESNLSTIARAALARQATGAVVEAWVSAARELARARRRALTLADLSAIVLPPAKLSSESETTLALHECAHAVAGRALGIGVPLVSIVAAGRSLGRASFDFGAGPLTRDELERHVTAGLAGRAADELFCGGAEAGAMGDLREATRMVAGIHRVLGLGAKLSSRGVLETADEMLALDPDLARLVESELQRLMGDARRLVRDCEPAIRALAQTLLTQRVVDQRAIDAALARSGVRPGSARLGERP
ncbi:AAA family ATPase [Methylopila sp. Yamaguchi]|uniref:AAA family ATPase n=1 Tax=Methylopila sp. Yamaguchi TaxID=1437817 RepID=UPI000CAD2483|nr:AAA family ATPase [Methylopila sp. Yamaguchi]GBD46857.1 cell division protein FtsH [Methylopila sp. Yamaguchi]